jgi:hypothetical protein
MARSSRLGREMRIIANVGGLLLGQFLGPRAANRFEQIQLPFDAGQPLPMPVYFRLECFDAFSKLRDAVFDEQDLPENGVGISGEAHGRS